MNAVVYTEYGPPDVLQLKEVEKPAPTDGEALVRVHAASVNYSDWSFLRGKPSMVRLMGAGLLRPENPILGADIAGRVEAVGEHVEQFQPGHEVFGDISDCGYGGFAEYVSVPETALALKPANIGFDGAAAVPQAAAVALQGLRDKGGIQPGQRVLIVGASGGVGTFAVQIAKSYGAEVTGVCSTRNLELVQSIGADHVIDYTQEDFAENEGRYDLILATAGYRSIFDYRRALGTSGTYVSTGGAMAQTMQAALIGPWLSTGGKKMGPLASTTDLKDLVLLRELVEKGKVVPVIDRRFQLGEVPEALRYYGKGHARGKVVIVIHKGDG